jgi:purine catabolism regulator
MGIAVRDAMRIGGLTGCRVVAGEKGLEREIEYIAVMEVPDVIRWLKGRDLLLTSLFPIKDDEEAIRCLVQQLADIGSAALAIKTHRFIGEIPEIVIAEGNRLNFPIIEIDNEVSYLDIMTPLMRYILKKPEAEQENLDMFFQWVTELAMGGKGIPAIVQAVEHVTGNLITVESEFSFIEGIVHKHHILPLNRNQKNELRTSKRSIRMARNLNGLETSCIVTPLLLKDELYGYVTCWQTSKPFREQDFVILDRIISLLALEFLKAKTEVDVVQAYKDDFLKDILLGEANEEEEVIASARKFGWDLTKEFQVFVVCFDNSAFLHNDDNAAVLLQRFMMSLLQRMADILSFVSKTTIVGVRKDTLVVLYPVDAIVDFQESSSKKKTVPIAEQILKQLKLSFDDSCFTIGMGRFHKGIRGIQSAYREATNAAQLGKAVWGKDKCIHFDDLGIYRILGQFHDRKELESLYAESVGKLVDFDRNNQSRLLETLSEYFHNNYVLTETAEKLFIHINTLKYRLQKIEQLTGCSINNAEERLRLHISLKIKDILNNPV